MFDLLLLAAPFASDFGQDILLPAIVGGVVCIWIGNSLLGHFGYKLF